MDYLLAVYHEELDMSQIDPADMERAYKEVAAFNQMLEEAGALVFAGGLQPPSTAVTLNPQDGMVEVAPWPALTSKEQLGGFWVIRTDDPDQARKWAEQGALACGERTELRPFQAE